VEVQIVTFPETKVAAIEHWGQPSLEHDTVRKPVAWKLEQKLFDPAKYRGDGVHYTDPRTTPASEHHVEFCLSIDREVGPNSLGRPRVLFHPARNSRHQLCIRRARPAARRGECRWRSRPSTHLGVSADADDVDSRTVIDRRRDCHRHRPSIRDTGPRHGHRDPMLIPPIVAAACGYFLGSSEHHRDAVAFISGVIGTLIGADLLNLRKLRDLGAPVASIGGAGTFDGIFLTGIVAVLLA